MSFRFDYFQTSASTGTISNQQTLNVIEDFTLNRTVGDESEIRSGDITLRMRAPLPFTSSPGVHNWVGVYYNGTLYDVFYIGESNVYDRRYEIFDENAQLYQIRLESLQTIFYRHMKNTRVVYSAASADWSFNLGNAVTFLNAIKVKDGTGADQTASSRYGFALSELIASLGGTNNFGYNVRTANIYNTIDLFTANDLPLLYRGLSTISTATQQDAINQTFSDHEIYWIDLVRIFVFAYNAFISATPAISGSVLHLDFEVKPKIKITSTSSSTLTWSQRRFVRHKHRIDGVKLTGKNFEYTQGNFNSDNIFKGDLPIFDPSVNNSNYADSLYWSKGINYNIVFNSYDILDGGGNILPYNSSGLIEAYYDPFIGAGHGYEGEIIFGGEQLMTEYAVGADKIHLINLNLKNDALAEVEAIVVSP